MGNSILSVAGLEVAFGSRVILHSLSLEIPPAACVAIIGPNGSGKTVLLKALLGLLPYKGEIRWDVSARPGYVPQQVVADRHLPLTPRDLLEAKARTLKRPAAEVEEVAGDTDLTADLLDTNLGHLSGGQFQKALIAFALLGAPSVLLFDEPTASLDELSEERVYDLLHSLQQQRGMTLLLVSHDLSVVYRYADTVLCLSKGQACVGPPKDVLTPAMLEQLYAAPSRYYRHHEHAEDVPERR
ncbi:MAG: ABC transporter ATP-binding protein [Acidobacteria bacterium]|nr:MAG: ABC transporter ATP-binding protein [Acidobacteriota bacterium]